MKTFKDIIREESVKSIKDKIQKSIDKMSDKELLKFKKKHENSNAHDVEKWMHTNDIIAAEIKKRNL